MFVWVYFGYMFFFAISLFSISERDLFFLSEVQFFTLKVSLHSFTFLLSFVLFVFHILYLTKEDNQEIFFFDFNFLKWKIYPHENKIIQNVQFLFYNVVVGVVLFIHIFFSYLVPFILLTFGLIKFSKLQDILLDWYYFLLLLLDTWFIVFYLFYTKKEFELLFQVSKSSLLNSVFVFFIKYLAYPILGIFLCFAFVNFYFSNSILLSRENREIQTYTINSLFCILNPIFYESSEEYSFLFPRLNLAYHDLTTEKNIYFNKRNFRYANFAHTKLKFISFHFANTNFAYFHEAKWE